MPLLNERKTFSWANCRPYFPLVIGILASILFIAFWKEIKASPLFPPTAFDGIKFVYAMFVGSIVTTISATIDYRNELQKMQAIATGSDGEKLILYAFRFLFSGIAIIVILPFVMLLFPEIFKIPDPCSSVGYQTFIHTHDIIVGIIFLSFLVADGLTLEGMRRARRKIDNDAKSLKSEIDALRAELGDDDKPILANVIETKSNDLVRLHDSSVAAIFAIDFSKLQLRLIDGPVLIGLVAIFVITQIALGDSGWNASILKIDPTVLKSMIDARTINLFSCNGRGITIYEFQENIVGIFSAGIAMGFVTASVIMSQIIFIALNVLHDSRMDQVDKSGPADIGAAIDRVSDGI